MIAKILEKTYRLKLKLLKTRRMFSIPRGQKVLDIGGGDGPFPRADVVCEKFIGDSTERTTTFMHNRPLVMGDLEALPFVDKAFDFVFCSHVLEHASDPEKAIQEIMRVGKRGYIEVPSKYHELTMMGTPTHVWTIDQDKDGTLIFEKKDKPIPTPIANKVFNEQLFNKDSIYMAYIWKNHYRLFNIGLSWEGHIPYRIISKNGGGNQIFNKGTIDTIETIKKLKPLANDSLKMPRSWLKTRIQKIFNDPNCDRWLLDNIACPECQSKFSRPDQSTITCPQCSKAYPYINGIPVLLKEHATT